MSFPSWHLTHLKPILQKRHFYDPWTHTCFCKPNSPVCLYSSVPGPLNHSSFPSGTSSFSVEDDKPTRHKRAEAVICLWRTNYGITKSSKLEVLDSFALQCNYRLQKVVIGFFHRVGERLGFRLLLVRSRPARSRDKWETTNHILIQSIERASAITLYIPLMCLQDTKWVSGV